MCLPKHLTNLEQLWGWWDPKKLVNLLHENYKWPQTLCISRTWILTPSFRIPNVQYFNSWWGQWCCRRIKHWASDSILLFQGDSTKKLAGMPLHIEVFALLRFSSEALQERVRKLRLAPGTLGNCWGEAWYQRSRKCILRMIDWISRSKVGHTQSWYHTSGRCFQTRFSASKANACVLSTGDKRNFQKVCQNSWLSLNYSQP
jgi:hypothetical protein